MVAAPGSDGSNAEGAAEDSSERPAGHSELQAVKLRAVKKIRSLEDKVKVLTEELELAKQQRQQSPQPSVPVPAAETAIDQEAHKTAEAAATVRHRVMCAEVLQLEESGAPAGELQAVKLRAVKKIRSMEDKVRALTQELELAKQQQPPPPPPPQPAAPEREWEQQRAEAEARLSAQVAEAEARAQAQVEEMRTRCAALEAQLHAEAAATVQEAHASHRAAEAAATVWHRVLCTELHELEESNAEGGALAALEMQLALQQQEAQENASALDALRAQADEQGAAHAHRFAALSREAGELKEAHRTAEAARAEMAARLEAAERAAADEREAAQQQAARAQAQEAAQAQKIGKLKALLAEARVLIKSSKQVEAAQAEGKQAEAAQAEAEAGTTSRRSSASGRRYSGWKGPCWSGLPGRCRRRYHRRRCRPRVHPRTRRRTCCGASWPKCGARRASSWSPRRPTSCAIGRRRPRHRRESGS
jgi:hypothetical protein